MCFLFLHLFYVNITNIIISVFKCLFNDECTKPKSMIWIERKWKNDLLWVSFVIVQYKSMQTYMHTPAQTAQNWFNFTICLLANGMPNRIFNGSINWTMWTVSGWWCFPNTNQQKAKSNHLTQHRLYSPLPQINPYNFRSHTCLHVLRACCSEYREISRCLCRLNSISTHLFPKSMISTGKRMNANVKTQIKSISLAWTTTQIHLSI